METNAQQIATGIMEEILARLGDDKHLSEEALLDKWFSNKRKEAIMQLVAAKVNYEEMAQTVLNSAFKANSAESIQELGLQEQARKNIIAWQKRLAAVRAAEEGKKDILKGK